MTQEQKAYLSTSVPTLLEHLDSGKKPQFGLMTAQHMAEHLSYSIKSCIKEYPDFKPDPRHDSFKRFIAKGAVFEHRPNDKTAADLPQLKYESLTDAKSALLEACQRFVNHYESNPAYVTSNPFFGALNQEEASVFTVNHVKYHLEEQFGLSV